jgi:hypothetical protein
MMAGLSEAGQNPFRVLDCLVDVVFALVRELGAFQQRVEHELLSSRNLFEVFQMEVVEAKHEHVTASLHHEPPCGGRSAHTLTAPTMESTTNGQDSGIAVVTYGSGVPQLE